MIVTLTRIFRTDTEILGTLEVDGLKESFYTCELPDRNNEPNISCIPVGTYKMEPYTSSKHGRCFAIHGVVGRTLIRMHIANKPSDLLGCIAVGLTGGKGGCQESADAMKKLLDYFDEKRLIIKEPVELVIENLYHKCKVS